jgi:glucose/arabinose dehydrogenase
MLAFGPDGYLYVAVGDGGDGGRNAQKPENFFGTILRLDIDNGEPYAIPANNPFLEGGGAPEVWAFGLRNPWRFSIDHETGLMYIGDVGQEAWEEVDVISLDGGGLNLGWAYREGSRCFSSPECDETDSVFPVVEYPHSEGCSVTGGYVYRGAEIPELIGHYFYSDWCSGWVRSFRYDGTEAVDLQEWPELDPGQVNTFGTDGFGELYLGTWSGEVWKLVPIRAEP